MIEKLERDLRNANQKKEELKPIFIRLRDLQVQVNENRREKGYCNFGTINMRIENSFNKVYLGDTKDLIGNCLGRIKKMVQLS